MNNQQRDALRRLLWRANRNRMEPAGADYSSPQTVLYTYTFSIDGTFWVPMTHTARVYVRAFSDNWWAAQSWSVSLHQNHPRKYVASLREPESYEQIKNWVRMVTAIGD